jgi:hypothetical protein
METARRWQRQKEKFLTIAVPDTHDRDPKAGIVMQIRG